MAVPYAFNGAHRRTAFAHRDRAHAPNLGPSKAEIAQVRKPMIVLWNIWRTRKPPTSKACGIDLPEQLAQRESAFVSVGPDLDPRSSKQVLSPR